MRKLIFTLVIINLTLFNTVSFSYDSNPQMFITELVGDAIETLSSKNISKLEIGRAHV